MSEKNKKEVMNFGLHLTLDGYGGNPKKLNDQELIRKCLDELPEKIGMRKLAEPEVLFCPECNDKDSGGYSGFVVVMESHISCHTFPFRQFVSIDVYTCGEVLDQDLIIDYFKKAFDLQEVEKNFFKRGTKFPVRDLIDKV